MMRIDKLLCNPVCLSAMFRCCARRCITSICRSESHTHKSNFEKYFQSEQSIFICEFLSRLYVICVTTPPPFNTLGYRSNKLSMLV